MRPTTRVKPVMDALEEHGAQFILVHTGQHYDPAMSDVFFDDLVIRPDHFLDAGSGSHATQTCRVMTAFEPLAAELAPDVVVVIGDVNSTLACGLVTAKLGVPLAHVEAGLRSRDRSMPEEINRIVTDRVSDDLFAPSADAVDNLRAEGFAPEQIHLVGNVMVDTLLANADRAANRGTLARLGLQPGQYGLVILHRPANVDDPPCSAGCWRRWLRSPARAVRSCCPPIRARTGSCAAPGSRTACGSSRRPVPGLHRAGDVGAAGPDRLRRGAGGNHRAQCPVPDAQGQDRTADHHHRGHQPARGAGPRPDRGSRTRGAGRTTAPAGQTGSVGQACRATDSGRAGGGK